MDWVLVGFAIDLSGWALWFALTRKLAQTGGVERWVTIDYYASTLLLIASSVCVASGALLTDMAGLTEIAVAVGLVAVVVLLVRSMRGVAQNVRLQFAARTQKVKAPRKAKEPKRREEWASVTLQEIENMEVV